MLRCLLCRANFRWWLIRILTQKDRHPYACQCDLILMELEIYHCDEIQLALLLLALHYDWNEVDANPKESPLNSQMLCLCIHRTHAELALSYMAIFPIFSCRKNTCFFFKTPPHCNQFPSYYIAVLYVVLCRSMLAWKCLL